jgi:hypothetical protein
MILSIVAVLLITVQMMSPAIAEDDTEFYPAQGYPGYSSATGSFMVSSLSIVQTGLLAFYRVHGQWPLNWQAVEDEWFAGQKLYGFQLEAINPDDRSLEFAGDVAYLGEQPDGSALVIMLQDVGSMRPFIINLPPPKNYYKRFREADQFMQSRGFEQEKLFASYLSDAAKLKQFAMVYEMSTAIANFFIVHHRYPADMRELLRSELCPIPGGMLNPVTRLPFRFDGSANDLRYRTGTGDDGREWYSLEDIEESGEPSLVARSNLY